MLGAQLTVSDVIVARLGRQLRFGQATALWVAVIMQSSPAGSVDSLVGGPLQVSADCRRDRGAGHRSVCAQPRAVHGALLRCAYWQHLPGLPAVGGLPPPHRPPEEGIEYGFDLRSRSLALYTAGEDLRAGPGLPLLGGARPAATPRPLPSTRQRARLATQSRCCPSAAIRPSSQHQLCSRRIRLQSRVIFFRCPGMAALMNSQVLTESGQSVQQLLKEATVCTMTNGRMSRYSFPMHCNLKAVLKFSAYCVIH